MADICNKCGKRINNNFDKIARKKDNKTYEFHSKCFDMDKFYDEE